ncbi:hypothetical protein HanIR_Chr04g0165451 [Helianthus annuus]|nr:hypothetical protein HanIR_Chr04g0165451 [Helianthus annuus]
MICMLITLLTNCHVDSSKMLYTYVILFKPCVDEDDAKKRSSVDA